MLPINERSLARAKKGYKSSNFRRPAHTTDGILPMQAFPHVICELSYQISLDITRRYRIRRNAERSDLLCQRLRKAKYTAFRRRVVGDTRSATSSEVH